MQKLNAVGDRISWGVERFLIVALAFMVIIIFTQVILRVLTNIGLLNTSIPWGEESARYVMIYMVYFGAVLGVQRGSHIAITIIDSLLPKFGQRLLHIFAYLLSLVFFTILIVFGYEIMMSTMPQTSPALNVRMGLIYAALPISGALMFFYTVGNILKEIASYRNVAKESANE